MNVHISPGVTIVMWSCRCSLAPAQMCNSQYLSSYELAAWQPNALSTSTTPFISALVQQQTSISLHSLIHTHFKQPNTLIDHELQKRVA